MQLLEGETLKMREEREKNSGKEAILPYVADANLPTANPSACFLTNSPDVND